ncbi:type II toxin-antitoxin system VapC family toxin [Luteimicrobium sp. DT211]|uniref:type II toxin-antitoxin system VapC family toxin n=1 Tax=Luteimicrobium sp. DT211 TaxID=3393412 RepID=UPI003CF1A3C9
MIVETSALIALALDEPEAAAFEHAMTEAEHLAMSAANYVEAFVVAENIGDPVLARQLEQLIRAYGIEIVPVSALQAATAAAAYRDYGRRSGHRAKLNFGDTFGYALAVTTDQPLLFKGDDFSETDVRRTLP